LSASEPSPSPGDHRRPGDHPSVAVISSRPYREVTVAALVLGVIVGIVLAAAMTFAGLVIGFVVPASAIAAILGWGLLRGLLGRGSIVENNINQTVASAVNNTAAGVIFTFPALLLMEAAGATPRYNVAAIAGAAVAGAFLGTLFIIPLRKQMIELERLRFPSGIAVAEILRSPGAAGSKTIALLVTTVLALGFGLIVQFELLPHDFDLGAEIGMPAYMPNVWALSLFSLGAGYITGRAGLIVLAGGLLANWVIAPLVVQLGWVPIPEGLPAERVEGYLAGATFGQINRPLGIGFLFGGAIAGVALAAPMIKAAFASLRGGQVGGKDEMSVKWMYGGTAIAVAALFATSYFGDPSVGLGRAALTAIIATLWMWLAGVIIAQCTGRTDWSPVSGLALLAVTVVLLISGGSVGLAVLIGAAVCVAIAQGADMMTDLKTGYLVGSRPARQQVTQLVVGWMGPIISVITVYVIWKAVGFGPCEGLPEGATCNDRIPAPQANVLKSMVESIQGASVPIDKYAVGAIVGGILTLGVGAGMGVLVGLSMYLPMAYILPYGLGCILAMGSLKFLGKRWSAVIGLPIAAGLLVGDALAGVVYAVYKLIATAATGG
jgi:putative OPT family oligopeptide transporter